MSKVLLIIDMTDDEYKLFNTFFRKEIMTVDIGYYYDAIEGWSYLRKRLLSAKPMPEYVNPSSYSDEYGVGYNECIDKILGEEI